MAVLTTQDEPKVEDESVEGETANQIKVDIDLANMPTLEDVSDNELEIVIPDSFVISSTFPVGG